MKHESLTEDELGLVACAIQHPRFPVKPEYLPDAERLVQRGWLTRELVGGEVTFGLSQQGVTALELGVPLDDARAARN